MQKAIFILNNTILRVKPRPRHSAFLPKSNLMALAQKSTKNMVSVPTRTYMPAPYKDWCEEIGYIIRGQAARQKWEFMETGSITLNLYVEQIKARGDADNLTGSIMDAISGVIFNDDSQITTLHAEFKQTLKNRIEIEISENDPNDEYSQSWASHALSKLKFPNSFDKRVK